MPRGHPSPAAEDPAALPPAPTVPLAPPPLPPTTPSPPRDPAAAVRPPSHCGMPHRHPPAESTPCSSRGPQRRQHDLERRPPAHRARHLDLPSPPPHEIQREEQPQPRAALPCAEERLKNTLLVVGRDAAPVVDHPDSHLLSRLRFHGHLPARLRCLYRVQQQIDQRVLEFRFVRAHVHPRRRRPHLHSDRKSTRLNSSHLG